MRVLYLQADSRLLNPTLDQGRIDAAYADDPEAARSEFGGLFRSDISGYLDDATLDRVIVPGRRSLPRRAETQYAAFIDPSGGRSDSFTCGIAHAENGRSVLDKLVIIAAPFDPEAATVTICEALSAYGLDRATSDQYAGDWPLASFLRHGVTLEFSLLSASEIYAEALPLFTQGLVELLDVPQLRTELALLERRPRAGGKGDLIDHAPRAHDDAANACCGSLLLASRLPVEQPSAETSRCRTDYDPYSDEHRRRA